jgi:hypothetical protein
MLGFELVEKLLRRADPFLFSHPPAPGGCLPPHRRGRQCRARAGRPRHPARQPPEGRQRLNVICKGEFAVNAPSAICEKDRLPVDTALHKLVRHSGQHHTIHPRHENRDGKTGDMRALSLLSAPLGAPFPSYALGAPSRGCCSSLGGGAGGVDGKNNVRSLGNA